MKFRPAAIPLVTVDPYFSIWSFSDNLYDDYTRHWTGRAHPMYAGIKINGTVYTIMGKEYPDQNYFRRRQPVIEQRSVNITPLNTEYVFENELLKVTLNFLTPLLLQRLDIMSRPVSYIEYSIEHKKDGLDTEFIFAVSSECCVDNWKQNVVFGRTENSLYCRNIEQNILSESGDDICIDWGALHLADKSAKVVNLYKISKLPESCGYYDYDENHIYNAFGEKPYMCVEKRELSGVITIAYDEVKPIEYFGKKLDEYYTKYFDSFDHMLAQSIKEYPEIKLLCAEFDKDIIKQTARLSPKYEKITSLAYRQAIAAHKLVSDENGEILFLSKECFSNGCIGTLDVTYPSIPLFLKYNPELVLGMLRPIMKFAQSDVWKFNYAPHDVGQYPLANGQVYGLDRDKNELLENMQMPVEESGNFLLCTAAAAKYSNNYDYAQKHKDILKLWADYLVRYGYDPENQLCTDDFAGHLAHNCNLSIKAIMGIAAYGKLFNDKKYTDIAKEYADKWTADAKAKSGTRLSFSIEDSWSIKYNMVWDRLLNLNLFDIEVYKNETELYKEKINKYGVPLDSRAGYTKLDWLMWSTAVYDDKDYFDSVVNCIYNMICDTPDRVPMTDWYDTDTAREVSFQGRSVVGGLFINIL